MAHALCVLLSVGLGGNSNDLWGPGVPASRANTSGVRSRRTDSQLCGRHVVSVASMNEISPSREGAVIRSALISGVHACDRAEQDGSVVGRADWIRIALLSGCGWSACPVVGLL